MNKILILLFILFAACSTRPQVSNKPRLLTLAKYRVGNIIDLKEYPNCTGKVINIIDDSSDSYWYQIQISCSSEKIIKIVPQMYLDGKKEE